MAGQAWRSDGDLGRVECDRRLESGYSTIGINRYRQDYLAIVQALEGTESDYDRLNRRGCCNSLDRGLVIIQEGSDHEDYIEYVQVPILIGIGQEKGERIIRCGNHAQHKLNGLHDVYNVDLTIPGAQGTPSEIPRFAYLQKTRLELMGNRLAVRGRQNHIFDIQIDGQVVRRILVNRIDQVQ
jgi:hypothetical protein